MRRDSLSFAHIMGAHLTVRAARYAVYAAVALVLVLVAIVLVAPLFLDTPAVERALKAKLSQMVQGEVAWEKLSIHLLPSPRGALSAFRAEIPGVASVRAERVDARLRLLPLLRGSAEIASISLSRPAVRISPVAKKAAEEAPPEEKKSGPVMGYRSAIDAVRALAPEAVVEIEQGEVELELADMPPLRLHELELRGRTDSKGMTVDLETASNAWRRVKVAAGVDFADYSGSAKAELTGLKPQPWLDRVLGRSPVGVAVPEASLRVEGRTDGKSRLEGDFSLSAAAVELSRAQERVPLAGVEASGRLSASAEEVALRLGGATLGSTRLATGSLRYAPKSGSLETAADFDLDLSQGMDATRRLLPAETGKALERIRSVEGRAQGRVAFEMRRGAWSVRVDIAKSDSAVGIEGLPGPVKVTAGSVSAAPEAVTIEGADVSLLDARALASATIGTGKALRIEGTVPEGRVGEQLLVWIGKTAGVPPRVALRTPIKVAVQRAVWSPGQPLELAATAAFDSGPAVGVELGWTPKVLDLRRATIKDARSDAVLALHLEKDLLQGRFSGSLQGASIGAMLKGAVVPSGGWAGDLRVRLDLAHPERFSATGKLAGESVDLGWLLDRPVTIDRIDAQADGQKLRIHQASLSWAQQRFTLSGELARAPDGAPIIDARIDSPGVLVDALLKPDGAERPPAAEKAKPTEGDEELWKLWPLPVRGKIALRSKFVQYGERRAEPVVAALTLEAERAFLQLQQVQLCGISFPLTMEARPKGQLALAVRLTAQKQQLEQTARCLTEHGLLITGELDLSADLRTQGRRRELIPNLAGTIRTEAREGKVMKFALLGNILAMQNVSSALKGGPKLDEKGFPYRTITVAGRFESGKFIVEKGALASDAVGLAATGSISLDEGYQSDLTVLVAPLGFLNELVRKIPLIGDIGGTITSVPVRVSGDIRDPRIVPLGLRAVGSQLFDILEETAKVPGKLLPRPESSAPRQ